MLIKRGFTIVELLIVIVVIAILAAVTVAAYSGITARADDVTVRSDLKNTLTLMRNWQATTGDYPTYFVGPPSCTAGGTYNGSGSAHGMPCMAMSDGTDWQSYWISSDKQSFSVIFTRGSHAYTMTQDGTITKEDCVDDPDEGQYNCPSGFNWSD